MAYRGPKETKQDRINHAIANYQTRDDNDVTVIRNDPQPRSGRYLIWYGWKDDRTTGEFPKHVIKILTFQCSHIFKNGIRCRKEVCLGSDLCVDHLNWIGIKRLLNINQDLKLWILFHV
jgi:hypothetical protein